MQLNTFHPGGLILPSCLLVLCAAMNTNGYARDFEFGPWSNLQQMQLLSAQGMVPVERSTCNIREYMAHWSRMHQLEVLSYATGKEILVGPPSQVHLVVQGRIWGVAVHGKSIRIAASTQLTDGPDATDRYVQDFMKRFAEQPDVEAWDDKTIWRIDLGKIFNATKFTTSMDAHKMDVLRISTTEVDRDSATLVTQSDAGRILSITLGPQGELLRAGCDGEDLPLVLDCRLPWSEPHGFGGIGGASVMGASGSVPAFSLTQDFTTVDEKGEEQNIGVVVAVVLEGTGDLVFGPAFARYAFVGGQLVAITMLEDRELCISRGVSRRIPPSPEGVRVFREEAARFESEFRANNYKWRFDSRADLAMLFAEKHGFASASTFRLRPAAQSLDGESSYPSGHSVRGDSLVVQVVSSDNRVGEVVLGRDLSVVSSRLVGDEE
jgi:hypothetical protein